MVVFTVVAAAVAAAMDQVPKNATRPKIQTLPGKVIGRILLSRNQLLRVEKLAIGASANFVHHLGCPKNLWGYAVCWWVLENK